jgi:hypothetical protein
MRSRVLFVVIPNEVRTLTAEACAAQFCQRDPPTFESSLASLGVTHGRFFTARSLVAA